MPMMQKWRKKFKNFDSGLVKGSSFVETRHLFGHCPPAAARMLSPPFTLHIRQPKPGGVIQYFCYGYLQERGYIRFKTGCPERGKKNAMVRRPVYLACATRTPPTGGWVGKKSKLGPMARRAVKNFELFLHFCIIGIYLKKCAKFAPF